MMWDQGISKTPLWKSPVFEHDLLYVRYDMFLIYDHALTAFYGTNSYLYFGDIDEFLLFSLPIEAPVLHNTFTQGMVMEKVVLHMVYVLPEHEPTDGMHTGCLQDGWSSIRVARYTYNSCAVSHLQELYKCIESSQGEKHCYPKV